jgi:hypothetical protein
MIVRAEAYPGGRVIEYLYASSGDSYALNRADILGDTMAEYTWVGANLVASIGHPDLTGGLVLDYGVVSDYDGWRPLRRARSTTRTTDSTPSPCALASRSLTLMRPLLGT